MNQIRNLGVWAIAATARTGRATLFLFDVLTNLWFALTRFRLFIQQLHAVGVLTLLIILVSGTFIGMVLGYQIYNVLSDFGSESRLGQVVSLSLTRELGPVVAALLFAGRAGSALTAEIGLMKATDQLAAMEMMAVNPFKYVIAPRFLAGFVSVPLLAMMFTAVGIWAAYFIGVGFLGLDPAIYWNVVQSGTDFYEDVWNGILKSLVFGFVITWIAVFEGYDAVPTSLGVSQATTRTVVHGSLATLGLDFILTALMFGDI